ncbi:DUF2269 family protein [Cohnella suwonensis]|uniref:DUF2269 family protein n=1 Tax=Cohnella suwonensis TaxID=696072 RepID=A0ABW0LTT4_9BACL
MEWLVLVHVLAAIVGVGPVFFYLVLFRKNQTANELSYSVRLSAKLDFFPKIGGTLAVLSGIALVVLGSYGSFMQLWLFGSLLLYVLIQIVVIGLIAPRVKELHALLSGTEGEAAIQNSLHTAIRQWFVVACVLGFVLFMMMIAKPDI